MRNHMKTFLVVIASLLIGGLLSVGGPQVLAAYQTGSGAMAKDKNNQPIQAATNLMFEDETGTPNVSPSGSVSTLTLTVPATATYLHVRGAAAWKFGTGTLAGSTTGNGYCNADANQWVAIPCSGVSTVKVLPASGSTTFEFFFEVLKQRS